MEHAPFNSHTCSLKFARRHDAHHNRDHCDGAICGSQRLPLRDAALSKDEDEEKVANEIRELQTTISVLVQNRSVCRCLFLLVACRGPVRINAQIEMDK